jgi:phosphomannomutase
LTTPDGLRGVHLNEITRFHAAALTNAFVSLLMQGVWQEKPAEQPTIVVGYQEHPAAPDLMIGVVNALRATGVSIVDLGLTMAPELSFAVSRRQATGGVLVTGSGGNPSWIGLDFLLADGRPIMEADRLAQIEAARELSTFRLPQARGGYSTWEVLPDYEASLASLFHALRPLRIGFGSLLRRVNDLAERLFESLPCSLDLLPLPHRRRELDDPQDGDIVKLGEHVRSRSLHLGFLIDDDGRKCALVNDEGKLVPRDLWQPWLTEGSAIDTFPANDTSHIFETDALITLALVMSEMSRSDAQLSERLWVGGSEIGHRE